MAKKAHTLRLALWPTGIIQRSTGSPELLDKTHQANALSFHLTMSDEDSSSEESWEEESESSSEEEDPSMAEDFEEEVKKVTEADGSVKVIRAIKAGLIRAGAEPDSDKAGKIEAGETFEILEERIMPNGKKRIRMDRGWVSMTAKSGKPLCVSEAAVQNLLSSVPILQELSETERADIASSLDAEEFRDQAAIMYEGVEGDAMYFLEEGEAVAKIGSTVVKMYTRGDYFGELALVTGEPRKATVVAQGDDGARCLKLSKEDFDKHGGSTIKAVMQDRANYEIMTRSRDSEDQSSEEEDSDLGDTEEEDDSGDESGDSEDDNEGPAVKAAREAAEKEEKDKDKAVEKERDRQAKRDADATARQAKLKADAEARAAEREALAKKREEAAAVREAARLAKDAERKAAAEKRKADNAAREEERKAQMAKREEDRKAGKREAGASARLTVSEKAREMAAAAHEETEAKAKQDDEAKAMAAAAAAAEEAKGAEEAAAAKAADDAAATKAAGEAAAAEADAAAKAKMAEEQDAAAAKKAADAAAAQAAADRAAAAHAAQAEKGRRAAAEKAERERVATAAEAKAQAAAAAAAAADAAAAARAAENAAAAKADKDAAAAAAKAAPAVEEVEELEEKIQEAAVAAEGGGAAAAAAEEQAEDVQGDVMARAQAASREVQMLKQNTARVLAAPQPQPEPELAAVSRESVGLINSSPPPASLARRAASPGGLELNPLTTPTSTGRLSFTAARTGSTPQQRLVELEDRLATVQRSADQRRQKQKDLEDKRALLSPKFSAPLSPAKSDADAEAEDGDEQTAAGNDEEEEFELTSNAEEMLGNYSLEVSQITVMDGQGDKCSQWMKDSELHLRVNCSSHIGYVVLRLVQIIVLSAVLSVLPVVFKLGDPTDVSKDGVLNNLGYFIGYNAIGWGVLFLTMALWMSRIIGVQVSLCGAVILPTLFAMGVFFAGTIVLGAPIPLGTLTLGTPCFFVYAWMVSCFMIRGADGAVQAKGNGLLRAGGWMVVQLAGYACATLLVVYNPHMNMLVGIIFGVCLEMISATEPGPGFVPKTNRSSDGLNCARLVSILPLALHVTFTQFMFPVLGSTDDVMTNTVTAAIMNVYVLRAGLPTLDANSFRGDDAAEAHASFLFSRFILCLVQIVCPIIFCGVVAFNTWGYNREMFYILSEKDLAISHEGVEGVFRACAINIATNLLSAVLSVWVVYGWLKRNSSESEESLDDSEEEEEEEEIDLSRYTVLKALWIARKQVAVALKSNSELGSQICGRYPLTDAGKDAAYAAVEGDDKEEDEDEETGLQEDQTDEEALDDLGQLDLIVMSLGCMTTICGVCMVMQHDGMTLKGWSDWLSGGDMPYQLCPGFSFESECLPLNTTLGVLW